MVFREAPYRRQPHAAQPPAFGGEIWIEGMVERVSRHPDTVVPDTNLDKHGWLKARNEDCHGDRATVGHRFTGIEKKLQDSVPKCRGIAFYLRQKRNGKDFESNIIVPSLTHELLDGSQANGHMVRGVATS